MMDIETKTQLALAKFAVLNSTPEIQIIANVGGAIELNIWARSKEKPLGKLLIALYHNPNSGNFDNKVLARWQEIAKRAIKTECAKQGNKK